MPVLAWESGYVELKCPGKLNIGRGPTNEYQPESQSVSKLHAILELLVGGGRIDCFLEDLNSRNGTFIGPEPGDMEKLTPAMGKRKIKYGDYIRFGTTTTSSMDSNFYGTGSYQLISAQTGSDFNFSSSLYMNYITGSVPVNPLTQNWRIVRRVPNETFVLVSNLPTFTGKGLLVPYNFDPKYDPIEVAKKAGLL
jgi:hypothetical protein